MQKEINTKLTSAYAKTVEVVQPSNRNEQIITIQGILTSRIEAKPSTDIPAYGFFQFARLDYDIPVIFRIKENNQWIKPSLKKGSQVILEGCFTENSKERPSFTATSYQIIQEPEPLTIQKLKENIQSLLNPSIKEKNSWTQTTEFLFKKLEELKKIEALTKLGKQYLQAYFLLESAKYANYQTEHLPLTNFDLAKYLETISFEIERTERKLIAVQRKSHE